MIVGALVRKELIELRRDPITLALAVVMPVILLFLFGYGISLDVQDVRFAVLDQDRSQASAELVERFIASGYFHQVEQPTSTQEAARLLDRGRATVVLIVPAGYSEKLARGDAAQVQALIDGSFSATGLIVSNYVTAIVDGHSMNLAAQALARQGIWLSPPIRLDTRVWYNAPMKTVNYIVPGLFAVLLLAFPPMLTALAIVREKERGTIEQIYVSPLRPSAYILGKILPYAAIAFGEMLLVLAIGTLGFRIPFRGSVALLIGASLIYVFVTVAIGVFVSTSVRTQVAAVFLCLVATLMPSVLFSGFLFPIATMPYVMQLYTYAFPARYFTDISRDLFLKGVGLRYIWGNLLLLVAYAAALFTLATLQLRKKVA